MNLLMDSANEVFSAVVLAMTGYLVVLGRSFVKAKIDQYLEYLSEASRVRLEKAFDNIFNAAEAGAQGLSINEVVSYVQKMNPGDLEQLKLSGQKLRDRVSTAIAARAATAVKDKVAGAILEAVTKK